MGKMVRDLFSFSLKTKLWVWNAISRLWRRNFYYSMQFMNQKSLCKILKESLWHHAIGPKGSRNGFRIYVLMCWNGVYNSRSLSSIEKAWKVMKSRIRRVSVTSLPELKRMASGDVAGKLQETCWNYAKTFGQCHENQRTDDEALKEVCTYTK